MTSKTSRWPDPLALLCAVAGLTVSAWMWHSYSDPTAATCSTGGCDVARASAFAQWGPLSTPAIGVLGFGVLATLLLVPR
ncbi:MAG: hypothetical protein JKY37_34800, partial [Nannocystaceae bacterium]|nr:hypothetical protein [Nannocystaceae bacterium]